MHQRADKHQHAARLAGCFFVDVIEFETGRRLDFQVIVADPTHLDANARQDFDQAVDFFASEGYQSRSTGTIETKRGTSDPTYLYYTLGKLQILKLRADLEKKQGATFSLERFHGDFLKEGFPPLKIVRREMMGDDSPTL